MAWSVSLGPRRIASRGAVDTHLLPTLDWRGRGGRWYGPTPDERTGAMLTMEIDSIRVSLMNYQRVVILKEKGSERFLPIWIGSPEADAIAVKLQDVSVPRPLTHDLLGSVIGSLGGKVDHVVVSDLMNDTFYAKIALVKDGTIVEVDCRPSDAIAIAVRTEVPILVEDGVLDKAGIMMDRESGKPLGEDVVRKKERSGGTRSKTVTEEEMRSMSAFSEFLKDLPGLEELEGGAKA